LRLVARTQRSFENRDATLALVAPFGLLLLPVAWTVMTWLGYAMWFWAAGVDHFADALTISGSSLFTLGFSVPHGAVQTGLSFTEAMFGLGLIALLIAYLPSMYSAFARRESSVAMLAVRAGDPPTAVEMLTRFHRIGWLDQLDPFWAHWEEWFADIDESHTSLGALIFFRSPVRTRSWVTAAGTVLDAASLQVSTLQGGNSPQAQVCIRAGFVALRRICDLVGIEYDPDPQQGDPISISREEYDEVCAQLEANGLTLVADRDQAWIDYAGWRVNYDTVLLALAALVTAPFTPWTSDRSPVGGFNSRLLTGPHIR
ncbi:MAG: hypothetical protein R3249_10315, partial [Nitriliruptorales bacterium]|nr:hypothetical protein [Nitriliruptorales bacterium]